MQTLVGQGHDDNANKKQKTTTATDNSDEKEAGGLEILAEVALIGFP